MRAKGPSRRLPSYLLQNSDKNCDKDEMKSVEPSIVASAEDNRTIGEKAEACKERQSGQLKTDLKVNENVNNLKQKNDISSIFSSDSDDDIFSTFSSRSKPNALVSKACVGNNGVQSLPSSRERSLITSANQPQTKTDKLRNLFDSDDDLFVSSISVKEQEEKSARDKVVVSTKVIQEAIIPKKGESALEKKETVVPRKELSASKPKRVDIFDDDSDGDLFS